jgi:hypothetical protein
MAIPICPLFANRAPRLTPRLGSGPHACHHPSAYPAQAFPGYSSWLRTGYLLRFGLKPLAQPPWLVCHCSPLPSLRARRKGHASPADPFRLALPLLQGGGPACLVVVIANIRPNRSGLGVGKHKLGEEVFFSQHDDVNLRWCCSRRPHLHLTHTVFRWCLRYATPLLPQSFAPFDCALLLVLVFLLFRFGSALAWA